MNDEQLSVLMIPDYAEKNPYQAALVEALSEQGVSVDCRSSEGIAPILARYRELGRPDVVHLHWINVFYSTDRSVIVALLGIRLLLELLVLKLLGTPVVWTVHNRLEHEPSFPAIQRRIRRGVAQLSDRIIVHCPAARDIVRDEYGLSAETVRKVRVVSHGNYLGRYRNETGRGEAREELGISTDGTVFLYFGLIRRYKNVPGLLSAFADLADQDARLLVVGNPWSENLERGVETLAREDDRVHTELSFVPDESIQLYMNAADAVVLPFESVLTSGSAVLGMSFGRALVVPDTGCVGQLVDDAGAITYDPSDEEALRSALTQALERHEQLPGMGEHNLAAVEEYDWDRIADRTRRIYLSKCNGHSTGQFRAASRDAGG
ncbi:MAG: glycosyltransferase family 4 protein [Haloferacaceae archaeon]